MFPGRKIGYDKRKSCGRLCRKSATLTGVHLLSERGLAYGRSGMMVFDGSKRLFATDVGTYATSDEYVVVFALFGTEAAVGLALKFIVFVACLGIAFYVSVLSQDVDLVIDEQKFGSTVHVEPPSLRGLSSYFAPDVLSCVEVAVVLRNGIEYIARMHLFGTFCFEGITLNDEQGVVVVCGNLHGFPRE